MKSFVNKCLCRDEGSNGESHMTAWTKISPPEEKACEYTVLETGPCLTDNMDPGQLVQKEWCREKHDQGMFQGISSG